LSKYIYQVCLSTGRSHSKHDVFYKNVDGLGAKSPDFGGINNMCVIGHHLDADTIHMLCSEGIRKKSDVTVEEITKETLADEFSAHRLHTDLIEKYYLPYGNYPNIK
jgi:hypothetical protein